MLAKRPQILALFQWIVASDRTNLLTRMQFLVDCLGLQIDDEHSTGAMIFAKDKHGTCMPLPSRVTVMISANNGSDNEFQVEVRSSEPMLSSETRCELIASELQKVLC
jgi:hypothetical protein